MRFNLKREKRKKLAGIYVDKIVADDLIYSAIETVEVVGTYLRK